MRIRLSTGRAEISWPRVLLLTLVLLVGIGAGGGCTPGADEPAPDGWVEIGAKRIPVELAETASEQAKGLGYRDSLAWGHGMYFTYEHPQFYSFWMKGMRFSIDIIWIRQGRIVDLHRDVPFELGGNGPTVRPREVVDAVLEVSAGFAAASGWGIGDRVLFERAKRAVKAY